MTNCPNCNAILSYEGGLHCDYCGARFERPYSGLTVKVHSPEVDEVMARAVARGLFSVNEAREMTKPAPAGTHETR